MKKLLPYLALLGIIFGVLQIDAPREIAHAQGGGFTPPLTPIYCTNTCSLAAINVGQSAYLYQSSFTTKSVATVSADTVLQFTSVPAGVYWVNLQGVGSGATTAYGLNLQFQYTGSGNGYYAYAANAQCGTIWASFCTTANFPASEVLVVIMQGYLQSSTAGTIELSWSPSAAASTTFGNGIFYVTRLQ